MPRGAGFCHVFGGAFNVLPEKLRYRLPLKPPPISRVSIAEKIEIESRERRAFLKEVHLRGLDAARRTPNRIESPGKIYDAAPSSHIHLYRAQRSALSHRSAWPPSSQTMISSASAIADNRLRASGWHFCRMAQSGRANWARWRPEVALGVVRRR